MGTVTKAAFLEISLVQWDSGAGHEIVACDSSGNLDDDPFFD